MAIRTSFLNDGVAHDAVEFTDYFKKFITNGIFTDPANGLSCTNPSGRTINVSAGAAFVQGAQIVNDGQLTFTLDTTPTTRVDRIVVTLDQAIPSGTIEVLKGTNGSTTAPALTRTTSKWQLGLCEIMVTTNGVSSISDTRGNTSVCGWVQNFMGEIDSTGLFEQWETEFENTLNSKTAEFNTAISEVDAETAGLYGSQGRQGFMNPQFQIAQRYADASWTMTTGTRWTCDRWAVRIGGRTTTSAITINRWQDGARNSLYIRNKPYSGTSGSGASCLLQNIENGVRTFCAGGKEFTVSFDAKSTVPQKLAVEPVQFVDTSSTGVSLVAQSVNLTASWQRFSLTFTGTQAPTAEQVNNVLKIGFFFAWTGYATRFGSEVNNDTTVSFANMQINEGDSALPCYAKPVGDELESCRRYYRKSGMTTLSCGPMKNDRTVKTQMLDFAGMRVPPTLTLYDRANTAGRASWELISTGIENGHAVSPTSNSDGFGVSLVVQPLSTSQVAPASILFGAIEADAELTV